MKVFFDSNVIIDALIQRDINCRSSVELLRCVIAGKIKGYISAKQITDIYYVIRHSFKLEEDRRHFIGIIIQTFEIISTTKADINYCLNSKMSDLEDALLDEVCSVNCIDYLVTNNVKDFAKAKSTIFTPEQLLTLIEINK